MQNIQGPYKQAPCPPRILFICVENANRSQMAEAFVHILAGESIEAFSAGSCPSGKINSKAIEAMQALGYDLSKHDSKSVQTYEGIIFDHIVTMGCGDKCPNLKAKQRTDWSVTDSKHLPMAEFLQVRDFIKGKVEALLANSYLKKPVKAAN